MGKSQDICNGRRLSMLGHGLECCNERKESANVKFGRISCIATREAKVAKQPVLFSQSEKIIFLVRKKVFPRQRNKWG